MPIKQRVQLRDISTAVVGGTVVINCPVGPRYHSISLKHGDTDATSLTQALANITMIRVKRNGRVQRTMTGGELRDMNLLFGTTYDAVGDPNVAASSAGVNAIEGAIITIYFAEPWRQEPDAQDALAWSTDGWESFTVEVDVSTAVAPFVRATAIIDNVVNRNAIVKWLRVMTGASGTSFDYTAFDKRDFYQQISIYPCSGAATLETNRATFRVNGQILHERSAAEQYADLIQAAMNPRSGRSSNYIYDLVFDHDGLLGSAVPLLGVRDVSLTIEATAAMSGTTTMIIQRLGAPE